LGHTLDLIIPEHLRERHGAGYHQAMATGATRYDRELLAVPARRKDGTRLSLEFTIYPLNPYEFSASLHCFGAAQYLNRSTL
jgi:hypothetical protein